MENYESEIDEIKKKLDKANRLKVKSETTLENLEDEREKLLAEIREQGVEPEELEEEIEVLEEELKQLIKEAKDLLPADDILEGRFN